MLSNRPLLFTGNANRDLAERIAARLGLKLGEATVSRFPDGEVNIKVQEDVRGADVFVVQPTCVPHVNAHLMELLILIDALRRASASRITAVIPYFGYARQDRKDEGRVPITAKLVANLITTAGASRVLTIDLHAAQIQGFFDIPVDHLYASPVQVQHFRRKEIADLVVASPDLGGVKMAWAFAKRLNAYLAVVEKRRVSPQETHVGFLVGDVEDKNVVIVDDIIATGGSILEAAKLLKRKGARDIFLCATHPVLCGPAVERLNEAPVREIVVTDTVPIDDAKRAALGDKLRVLSVAELLGDAIQRIHTNQSVSSLFLQG